MIRKHESDHGQASSLPKQKSQSARFGARYQQHRARGKKANVAITIVARRMYRIMFQLLRQKRVFAKVPVQSQNKVYYRLLRVSTDGGVAV